MLFLLLAFCPPPHQIAASLKSLTTPKTVFFVFWILVFVVSHLWNFRTAPWNGNALFDESGWDLFFVKSYIMHEPFQAAWFDAPFHITRESLFHYYVWGFLRLFGYNILSFEAAQFVIWGTTFIFTLLLVDLFFCSYIVTSITALIFNFLPFAFVYTFGGFRYPMGTVLCVASVYFLHLGFKRSSSFFLSLGGIAAGLCLASSISGKQYIYALVLFALIYAGFHWKNLIQRVKWSSVGIVAYGFAVAAVPIIGYIVFNYGAYTLYEGAYINSFWQAFWGQPSPEGDMKYYITQLWNCFFSVPGPRFFIPDALPIPLPYYVFILPGLVLAVFKRRNEIALLAIIPVVAAFVSGAGEHRLLLGIPFWIILMGFTLASLLKLRLRASFRTFIWGASPLVLMLGLVPSIQFIYEKTKDPFSIPHYAQKQVAVSRFFREVVAGKEPANPPRLAHDEFNRVEGIPDAPYETFICQNDAFSIIHLFLHDYDDRKILSFCGSLPFFIQTEQDVWSANKRTLVGLHLPSGKDLKLIWERDPKTDIIIRMFEPLLNLGTEELISYSFGGIERRFYVLNIGSKNIAQFQERVRTLPDSLKSTPTPKPPTTPARPAAATSGGWTFCANETEQCNFSGTKQVRFGANDVYSYGTFSDGVACSNAAFGGDPVAGVSKHCDYAESSTPTPTPPSRLGRRSQ